MIKRAIFVNSPSRLSLKNNQLVCTKLDAPCDVKTAPVEDLGVVIVENQRAVLSMPLLNALAENNVSVIICDAKTMPSSVLTSLSANATQGEMIRAQVSARQSLRSRLWKQVVEAKIRNQAALLNKLGKDGSVLRPYYSNVKRGDLDNREGIAAKVYWSQLFGADFVRNRGGEMPNGILNYGYSVLRCAVARALLGSGINPSLGIFHRNRYNPMPLADDIMEPFRPYVDEIVYSLYTNGEDKLSSNVKGYLLRVLSCDTFYGDLLRPLQVGLSYTTASLGRCFMGEDKKIVFPNMN